MLSTLDSSAKALLGAMVSDIVIVWAKDTKILNSHSTFLQNTHDSL